MTDERSDAPVVDATDEVEIGLEAPERGSAEELLDDGAPGELDAMRHSAAHVMAEAVMDLFPGTKLGIGPAIDDGFYYDFELPRAAHPGRPAGDRGADAREHRRRPPVRAQRDDARRGARVLGRARPAVQGRDPRRPRWRRPSADGTPMPPTTFYEHGPFIDLCRGPHVASTGKIGPFKLLGVGRCVLARRREAPDAPAHLRHRLGDPGGARRLPVAPRGGEEARPSPARRPARPVQLPRRLARLGVLAPQGPDDLADARGRDARAPGAARLPGDQHADPRVARGSGGSRATGTSTRTTCSSSSPRTSPSASSR